MSEPDGVGSLAWQSDTFAYAPAFDDAEGRYVDLRHGSADFSVVLDSSSVLVKAEVRVAFISEGRARPIPKSLRTLMKADLIEG